LARPLELRFRVAGAHPRIHPNALNHDCLITAKQGWRVANETPGPGRPGAAEKARNCHWPHRTSRRKVGCAIRDARKIFGQKDSRVAAPDVRQHRL